MTTSCGPVMLLPLHVCFKIKLCLTSTKHYADLRWTSIEWPLVDTQGWPLNGAVSTGTVFLLTISEKNSLSFIETSALDSTNVEVAFHNILTGWQWTVIQLLNAYNVHVYHYCFMTLPIFLMVKSGLDVHCTTSAERVLGFRSFLKYMYLFFLNKFWS